MSEKLKPCPFCGGDAVMKIQKHIPNGYDYTPTCHDPSCAGRLTKKWINEADAIEAWNRRAERTAKVKRWDGYSEKGWYKCDCGKGIHEGQNYCSGCGAKLDWGGHE